MKTTILGTAAILLSLTTATPAAAQTADDGYRLVWADEFDYEGTPKADNWNFEHGFVRNNEAQWYQAENATVRDGALVITGKREHKANPTYNPEGKHWGQKRENIEYTSACLITEGKHEFLYGRFEIRARIPATRGSWPAIWFKGANGLPWPQRGEIDLLEFYPQGKEAQIHANACWGGKNGGSTWDSQAIPFAHWTQKDSLWATQFHVWRMDWEEDYIRLYLDDELLNEIDITKTINAQGHPGAGTNPFHTPAFLLLNLAMGSTGGPIDEQALPMRYEVDYVRVYQKQK